MKEDLQKEALEKSLETFKKALRHMEEHSVDEEELERINSSITEYEKKVAELKERLANEDNYKRVKGDFELYERPIIEELLQESIAVQKEQVEVEKEQYNNLIQDQEERYEEYQEEVEQLNKEIADINQMLYKDQVAQDRGYTKSVMSPEQREALQEELASKQELVSLGEDMMNICRDNISQYEAMVSDCDANMEVLNDKEERLNDIKENHINNPKSDIDTYAMRLDEDKLSDLESALEAFKATKDYMEFDSRKEMKERIDELESVLQQYEQNKENEIKNDEVTEEPNLEKVEEDAKIIPGVPKPEEPIIKVVDDTLKPSDGTNPDLDQENAETKKTDDDLDNSVTPTTEEPVTEEKVEKEEEISDEYKVTKVTSAKDFLKKHKKAILLAGGLAAIAILAQPVIIPAIMHANSVLWFHAPALQGFLHGCNVALGNVIGASYATTGLWTSITGAVINADAAVASLLAALTTHAVSLGAIGTAAKKLINKIKKMKKKKSKEEVGEKEVEEPIEEQVIVDEKQPVEPTLNPTEIEDTKEKEITEEKIASEELPVVEATFEDKSEEIENGTKTIVEDEESQDMIFVDPSYSPNYSQEVKEKLMEMKKQIEEAKMPQENEQMLEEGGKTL